jgi:hypothetical protein
MREPQIVTTSERHDLDEQAEPAFRPGWPEFIFHDPVSSQFIRSVETYFPQYDVLLLDDGQVVAAPDGRYVELHPDLVLQAFRLRLRSGD